MAKLEGEQLELFKVPVTTLCNRQQLLEEEYKNKLNGKKKVLKVKE